MEIESVARFPRRHCVANATHKFVKLGEHKTSQTLRVYVKLKEHKDFVRPVTCDHRIKPHYSDVVHGEAGVFCVNVKKKDFNSENIKYHNLLALAEKENFNLFFVQHCFHAPYILRVGISELSLFDVYSLLIDRNYEKIFAEVFKWPLLRDRRIGPIVESKHTNVMSRWAPAESSRMARLVGVAFAYFYQRVIESLLFISLHYSGVYTPDNVDLNGLIDPDVVLLEKGRTADSAHFCTPVLNCFQDIWSHINMNEVTGDHIPIALQERLLANPTDISTYYEIIELIEPLDYVDLRRGKRMSHDEFSQYFRLVELTGMTQSETLLARELPQDRKLTETEFWHHMYNATYNDIRDTDVSVRNFLPDYNSLDIETGAFRKIQKHTFGTVTLTSPDTCPEPKCVSCPDKDVMSILSLNTILKLVKPVGNVKFIEHFNLMSLGELTPIETRELASYQVFPDLNLIDYLREHGIDFSHPLQRSPGDHDTGKIYVKAYNYAPSPEAKMEDLCYAAAGIKGSCNSNLSMLALMCVQHMFSKSIRIPEHVGPVAPHAIRVNNPNSSPGPIYTSQGKTGAWISMIGEQGIHSLVADLAHGTNASPLHPHAKPQNTEKGRTRLVNRASIMELIRGKVCYQAGREYLAMHSTDSFSAVGFSVFYRGFDRLYRHVFEGRFRILLERLRKEACVRENRDVPMKEIEDLYCVVGSSDLPKSDKKGKPFLTLFHSLLLYRMYNTDSLAGNYWDTIGDAFKAFHHVVMPYSDVYYNLNGKLLHFYGCTVSGGPNTVEGNTCFHMYLAMSTAIQYYIEKAPMEMKDPKMDEFRNFICDVLWRPFKTWDIELVVETMKQFVIYISDSYWFNVFLSDDAVRYFIENYGPDMAYSMKRYFMLMGYETTPDKWHHERGIGNIPDFCSAHPVDVDGTKVLSTVRPEALAINLVYPLEEETDITIYLARIYSAAVTFATVSMDTSMPEQYRRMSDVLLSYVSEKFPAYPLSKLLKSVDKDREGELFNVLDVLSQTGEKQKYTSRDVLDRFFVPSTSLEALYDVCDYCNRKSQFQCMTCEPFGVCCNIPSEETHDHVAHHVHRFGHVHWKYNGHVMRCLNCKETDITQLYINGTVVLCEEHCIGRMQQVVDLKNPIENRVVDMIDSVLEDREDFLSERVFLRLHSIATYNSNFYLKALAYYTEFVANDAKTVNFYRVVEIKGLVAKLVDNKTNRPIKYRSEITLSHTAGGKYTVVEATPNTRIGCVNLAVPLSVGVVLQAVQPYAALERCLSALKRCKQLPAPLEHFFRLLAVEVQSPMSRFLSTDMADEVAQSVFKRSFSVVLGFPGTGKTFTAARILRRAVERNMSVIVLSTTHVSVDELVKGFIKECPQYVDKAARNTPAEGQMIEPLLQPYSVKEGGKLPQILFSTTMTSLPKSMNPSLILIDEFSLVHDYVWIPCVLQYPQLKHLTFLGDPYQLSPIQLYDYKDEASANIVTHRALQMDRNGHQCLRVLVDGRRSVEQITLFVGSFYQDRMRPLLPRSETDPIRYSIAHGLTQTEYGSHCNASIKQVIKAYLEYSKIHPTWNIIIICTYKQAIQQFEAEADKLGITLPLFTIDSSQGKTVDCVLYSLDGTSSFVRQQKRLIVAISRARYLLHIFFPSDLSDYPNFGNVVAERGKFVESFESVSNLEATDMVVGQFLNPRYEAKQLVQSDHYYSNRLPPLIFEGDLIALDVEAMRFLPYATLPAVFQCGVVASNGDFMTENFRPSFKRLNGSRHVCDYHSLALPKPVNKFPHFSAVVKDIYAKDREPFEYHLDRILQFCVKSTRIRPTFILYNGALDCIIIVNISKFGPVEQCKRCRQSSSFILEGGVKVCAHHVDGKVTKLYNPLVIDLFTFIPRVNGSSLSLGMLAEREGLDLSNAHDAVADARVTLELFCKLFSKKMQSSSRLVDIRQKADYKELSRCSFDALKSVVEYVCRTYSEETILDVGCGRGILKKLKTLPPNYFGIDIDVKLPTHKQLQVAAFEDYTNKLSLETRSNTVLLFIHSYLPSFAPLLSSYRGAFFLAQTDLDNNSFILPSGNITRTDSLYYYATPPVQQLSPIVETGIEAIEHMASYGIRFFGHILGPELTSSLEALTISQITYQGPPAQKHTVDLPGYNERVVNYVGKVVGKGIALARIIHTKLGSDKREIMLIGARSRTGGCGMLQGLRSHFPNHSYACVDKLRFNVPDCTIKSYVGAYNASVFGLTIFDVIISDAYVISPIDRENYFCELASSLPFKLQGGGCLLLKITCTFMSEKWLPVISKLFMSTSIIRLPDAGCSSELWLCFECFGGISDEIDIIGLIYGAFRLLADDEEYRNMSGSYAVQYLTASCIDKAKLKDYNDLIDLDLLKPYTCSNFAVYHTLSKMKLKEFYIDRNLMSHFFIDRQQDINRFILDPCTPYLLVTSYGMEFMHYKFMRQFFPKHDSTKSLQHIDATVANFDHKMPVADILKIVNVHLTSESHHDQYVKAGGKEPQDLKEIIFDRLSRHFKLGVKFDRPLFWKYKPEFFSDSEIDTALANYLPLFMSRLWSFENEALLFTREHISRLSHLATL